MDAGSSGKPGRERAELPLSLSRSGPRGVRAEAGRADRPERWRESMFVPGATAQPAGATALALPLVGGAQCLERRKPTRAPAREEAPGDLGARLPCRGKPKARGGRGSSRGTSTRHPSCMKSHQTGTCWPLLYGFTPSYCSIPLSGRRSQGSRRSPRPHGHALPCDRRVGTGSDGCLFRRPCSGRWP